jgi:DNA-binding transcriptional ArsR family regulator
VAEWDLIVAPSDVRVEFQVSAPLILFNSLHLITYYEDTDSGLHSWIAETSRSMTPEQKQNQKLVTMCFSESLMAVDDISFPDYLQQFEQLDAIKIRDAALESLKEFPNFPGVPALLEDETVFIDYLRQANEIHKPGKPFEADLWQYAYALFANPPLLRQFILDHLRLMWDEYLAKEWKRSQAMLHESANAYRRKDYSGLNAYDAVEAITGRDMRGSDKMDELLDKARRLIFMPSPHLGPYISWQPLANRTECIIMFGARMPKGAEAGSRALNRSELLVWLNALADDTRLKMLEMLLEHEELCAQDFIDMLELSQSSASRHLRQLAASGFLQVRRRDVNKCYTLNRARIDETLKALGRIVQK